jgi:cytidine deaminase
MHCHICDRELSPDEIKMTPAYGRGDFAPCGTCLAVIEEVFEPDSEEDLDRVFIDIELLSDENYT